MVDSYIWGSVERISPEAPVPILNCSKREDRLGGAANVVLNIKALGARPLTLSVIGTDDTSIVFKQRMEANQLHTGGLFESSERPTTRKTRMLGGKQQLLRVDEEITDLISGKLESDFIAHCILQLNAQKVDALIFQDYDKGVVTQRVIAELTAWAKLNGIPTLVDPKKRNFLNFKDVTLFKPNFKELQEGTNQALKKGDFDKLFDVVKELHQKYQQQYLLVTLSELGVFVSDGTKYTVIPALIRDIADVSGAGDTVISIASLCLACKMSIEFTAALANMGGGLVCERLGVVPIEKEKLLQEALHVLV
jgi:rfaE bifunctional protein kinase chain/domain